MPPANSTAAARLKNHRNTLKRRLRFCFLGFGGGAARGGSAPGAAR